jgi:hypothetical protein
MLTKRDIEEQKRIEIKAIEEKYHNMLVELQNNCKHTYENGESALEYYCDEDDCNGWREPTYDEWNICKICGLTIEL